MTEELPKPKPIPPQEFVALRRIMRMKIGGRVWHENLEQAIRQGVDRLFAERDTLKLLQRADDASLDPQRRAEIASELMFRFYNNNFSSNDAFHNVRQNIWNTMMKDREVAGRPLQTQVVAELVRLRDIAFPEKIEIPSSGRRRTSARAASVAPGGGETGDSSSFLSSDGAFVVHLVSGAKKPTVAISDRTLQPLVREVCGALLKCVPRGKMPIPLHTIRLKVRNDIVRLFADERFMKLLDQIDKAETPVIRHSLENEMVMTFFARDLGAEFRDIESQAYRHILEDREQGRTLHTHIVGQLLALRNELFPSGIFTSSASADMTHMTPRLVALGTEESGSHVASLSRSGSSTKKVNVQLRREMLDSALQDVDAQLELLKSGKDAIIRAPGFGTLEMRVFAGGILSIAFNRENAEDREIGMTEGSHLLAAGFFGDRLLRHIQQAFHHYNIPVLQPYGASHGAEDDNLRLTMDMDDVDLGKLAKALKSSITADNFMRYGKEALQLASSPVPGGGG